MVRMLEFVVSLIIVEELGHVEVNWQVFIMIIKQLLSCFELAQSLA